MNFNNPEDDYSSSPVSGSSPMSGSDGVEEDEEDESEDGESTAMSLDAGDQTLQSEPDSTDSSAALNAALRQAAQQAGTRGIEYDEYGEKSMEIATEEVTNAFKPWVQQGSNGLPKNLNLLAVQDQENVNPFSPAFKAHANGLPTMQEEDEDDMSMDMTRAVGGILQSNQMEDASSEAEMEEQTMEFTQALGKIHQNAPNQSAPLKSALKRRRSTTDEGSPFASGKPGQQGQADSKRKRSSGVRSSLGDETMDFTMAIGGIQNAPSPAKQSRRESFRRRRSSGMSSAMDEQTMEFTMAVGGIKQAASQPAVQVAVDEDEADENEELSMELTTALGNIQGGQSPARSPAKSPAKMARFTTPTHQSSPQRLEVPTTPTDQGRFKEVSDLSARKLLTPVLEKQSMASPSVSAQGSSKRPGSVRKSARKSLAFVEPTTTPQSVVKESPQRPVQEVQYPVLPSPRAPSTPKVETPKANSSARSTKAVTPLQEHLESADTPSPSVEKQLRSTPARPSATPQKPILTEAPRLISDSIKLLSTPRKEVLTSPLKHLRNMTPAKSPMKKALTPRKIATPKARTPVAPPKAITPMESKPPAEEDLFNLPQQTAPVEKIQLNKFLDAAGIRFMDLTTTKRRHTVAPTPRKAGPEPEDSDEAPDLESAIVAGACTVPTMELYSHATRELKHYISEGKSFVKELEEEAFEETPAFVQSYVSGTPAHKAKLDGHLRDIKTHARLQAKEIWYEWRSKLLEGLENPLQATRAGLEADAKTLEERQAVLDGVLPQLLEQRVQLQMEADNLREAAAATSEEEKEELAAARERLLETNQEIEERKRMVEEFRRDLQEQERLAEAYTKSKAECTAAIKEADRVREACRGWSVDEVKALKESVAALQKKTGWAIDSASTSQLTMTYRSTLQLFFNASAFQPLVSAKATSTHANSLISLIYIDEKQPLTTHNRFFLQCLRAQLHALDQSQTSIKDLLNFVSSGWDTATQVAETVRRLRLEHPVDVHILSDERLGVNIDVLLPKVQSKVRVLFEMGASVGENGSAMELVTNVDARVVVVYGEKYKEKNMGEFVLGRVGDGLEGWEDAVRELRVRLVARGRKG